MVFALDTMFNVCSSPVFVNVHRNTTIFDAFTPCLTFVVIPIVPNVILAPLALLITFLSCRALRRDHWKASVSLKFTRLSYAKLIITASFSLISIIQLLIILLHHRDANLAEFCFNALTNVLFGICVLVSYMLCIKYGLTTSGVLHFTWIVKLITLIPACLLFVYDVFHRMRTNSMFLSVFIELSLNPTLCFVVTLAMVGLLCWADQLYWTISDHAGDDAKTSASLDEKLFAQKSFDEDSDISAISSFLFCYVSPVIRKGLGRLPLSYGDIRPLANGNRAIALRNEFQAISSGCATRRCSSEVKYRHVYSLFSWLICLTWTLTLSTLWIVIVLVALKFMNAVFLKVIVDSVQLDYPFWYSMLMLLGLFTTIVAQNLLLARREYLTSLSFLNVRSVLIVEIFMKMLRLSAASRAKYSTGELMNIITTDVQRIRSLWIQLSDFVYCPLMIAASITGLFYIIGRSTLYGVIVTVVMLPINYALSIFLKHYQTKQMLYKDQRLKLLNDILCGIRVLKLYAWEEPLQQMVSKIRQKELATLRAIFFIDGFFNASFQLGPALALIVSFYGYTIVDERRLTPDVAFVGLMFFSMLRYALCQLPFIFSNLIKTLVSTKRILRLLREDELENHCSGERRICRTSSENDEEINGKEWTVVFERCSFSWDQQRDDSECRHSSVESSAPSAANSVNYNTFEQISPLNDVSIRNRRCSISQLLKKSRSTVVHLSNISLSVRRGSLVAVVGRVGSGKSSLLSAILGEMEMVGRKGRACVFTRSVGYVSQSPWIQNQTVRDNILFERPMDADYYEQTLEACALSEDLRALFAGDLTEIGEKGINLSGGQRARVALARAVYQRSDLYILDDILSAVDGHVAASIFQHVIGPDGLLRSKTRIFATNSLSFLSHCDQIVVMQDGRIGQCGSYEELVAADMSGLFTSLMREYYEKKKKAENEENVHNNNFVPSVGGNSSNRSTGDADSWEILLEGANTVASPPQPSASNVTADDNINDKETLRLPASKVASDVAGMQCLSAEKDMAHIGRLVDDEELPVGVTSRRLYATYIRHFGLIAFIGFVSVLVAASLSDAMSNVWLSQWSARSSEVVNNYDSGRFFRVMAANMGRNSSARDTNSRNTDIMPSWISLTIYGAFAFSNAFLLGASAIFLSVGACRASRTLHDDLLMALLRVPITFFERTPIGRVMNRLGGDVDRVDEAIPLSVNYICVLLAMALNLILAIVITIPPLALLIIPFYVFVLMVMYYFNKASVQLRRLSSKSWSHCLALVQDVYCGVESIRAFAAVARFGRSFCAAIDRSAECTLAEVVANCWIQIRLELMTNTLMLIVIFAGIILSDHQLISIGALAMVINSGISFTGNMGEITRTWRELEMLIVGVERIVEYTDLEPEADWHCRSQSVVSGGSQIWPSNGRIVFDRFFFRYRSNTRPVLRNLCFAVEGGTKVGIVGRTGAGKSSITMALFRMVEPFSGRILIDDVDITTIGLHDLRKSLIIIPQDPVLFCGTLRSNLDPFDEFNDEHVWSALEKVHLSEVVGAFEDKLAHCIQESGSNLSVGQRQLVCLARALLRSTTKILILDEATATIDSETDCHIQSVIRENFHSCTILTIAHRLNTVLDYDRILVMENGAVIEYDTPQVLLSKPDSLFAMFARHAGITSAEMTNQ